MFHDILNMTSSEKLQIILEVYSALERRLLAFWGTKIDDYVVKHFAAY
jgi:hypothetical protein